MECPQIVLISIVSHNVVGFYGEIFLSYSNRFYFVVASSQVNYRKWESTVIIMVLFVLSKNHVRHQNKQAVRIASG